MDNTKYVHEMLKSKQQALLFHVNIVLWTSSVAFQRTHSQSSLTVVFT